MTGLKRLTTTRVARVPEFRLAPLPRVPRVPRVSAIYGLRGGQPVRVIDGTTKQSAKPKLKQSTPNRAQVKPKIKPQVKPQVKPKP